MKKLEEKEKMAAAELEEFGVPDALPLRILFCVQLEP